MTGQSGKSGGAREGSGRPLATYKGNQYTGATPIEWLWRELDRRYGLDDANEIHLAFNEQKRIYEKQKIAERKERMNGILALRGRSEISKKIEVESREVEIVKPFIVHRPLGDSLHGFVRDSDGMYHKIVQIKHDGHWEKILVKPVDEAHLEESLNNAHAEWEWIEQGE